MTRIGKTSCTDPQYINTLYGFNVVYFCCAPRAVFTHENQDPSQVKFIADGKGGASEFAEEFKDDGVFYGLCKSRSSPVAYIPRVIVAH